MPLLGWEGRQVAFGAAGTLGGEGWFGVVAGGWWWGIGAEVEGRVVGITEEGIGFVIGGVGGVVGVVLWRWEAGVVVGWNGVFTWVVWLEGRFFGLCTTVSPRREVVVVAGFGGSVVPVFFG